MATRSFANAKLLFILDGLSNSLTRRGYAAAAAAAAAAAQSPTTRGGVVEEKGGRATSSTNSKVSWVPDPVTGYYKPENTNEEIIDVANLRATLLAKKFNN